MEVGGRVFVFVICEFSFVRSLIFRSWRKLISESIKLFVFKKCS